jgi:serine/threonine protein kinase
VVAGLYRDQSGFGLFSKLEDQELRQLSAALAQGWRDAQAAEVVTAYARLLGRRGEELDVSLLCRWLLLHPNDAEAVSDCMSIEPPEGINISRRLPKAGSQKLVFEASWRLTQRQIVLKCPIGPPELQRRVMEREAQSHPLTMGHPNIIETHYLTNRRGEGFLVEERLPVVLADDRTPGGVHEAANLLYDLAKALNYLHRELGLVHGDVKPGNIGKKGDDYILLDFGICRPAASFTPDTTATGSLRTRAPELLEQGAYVLPDRADVWALGATVFNGLVGRFPLFDPGEPVPRVSHPEERRQMEEALRRRVASEWGERVDLKKVPEPLRDVLGRALARDPRERCSAAEILDRAEGDLTAFLRHRSAVGRFSPAEELQQLLRYLPDEDWLACMPLTERQALRSRLEWLRDTQPASDAEKLSLTALLGRVS